MTHIPFAPAILKKINNFSASRGYDYRALFLDSHRLVQVACEDQGGFRMVQPTAAIAVVTL